MSDIYHDGHRTLQDRFDTRRLADRLDDVKVHHTFTTDDRAFLERVDMFFLATADEHGRPNCSYKGGDPGFVRVISETELAFPCYDGNGMFLSMGNVLVNPHVGMLFVDFERPRRMRINGTATLRDDASLRELFVGAQFVVVVEAREIFPNCPRYIHRMQRVEASPYVPRAGEEAPIPAWKRADWASDVLPAGDPANTVDSSRSS